MKKQLQKLSCLGLSILIPLLMLLEIAGIEYRRVEFHKNLIEHSAELSKLKETIFLEGSRFANLIPGDEIQWNNQTFDIISVKKLKKGYLFTVFNDKIETKLSEVLSKMGGNNQNTEHSKSSIQSIQLDQISICQFATKPTIRKIHFTELVEHGLIGFQTILDLPPKSAC